MPVIEAWNVVLNKLNNIIKSTASRINVLKSHRTKEIGHQKELKMPVIGTRDLSPEGLNSIMKNNFSNPIAILERWYCNNDESPDFFNYLSKPHGKESDWDKGRVFDSKSEVRWERKNDVFHIVWIKDEGSIPDEWDPKLLTVLNKREIMLWGSLIASPSNNKDLASESQNADKNEWYEKQIPRVFDYPVKEGNTHVYAILTEYCMEDESKVYRYEDVVSK